MKSRIALSLQTAFVFHASMVLYFYIRKKFCLTTPSISILSLSGQEIEGTETTPMEEISHKDIWITMSLYNILPLGLQHYMRDVGILSFMNDLTVGIIAGLLSFKTTKYLRDFADTRNRVQFFQYGDKNSPKKFIEILTHGSSSSRAQYTSKPVLIFVHGGAWGSGQPYQYRLSACGIGSAIDARAVVVVGYAYYPQETILQQRDSILEAITFIKSDSAVQNILGSAFRDGNDSSSSSSEGMYVLSGHSSGANLCALALLANAKAADVFIALSGVYDITDHYKFEASRRVHEFSPMKAAAGDLPGFPHCSPTHILSDMTEKTKAGGNQGGIAQPIAFPYTIILHGSEDGTVPLSSSERFAEALSRAGLQCDMVIPPV
jgi:acetyl esterase/lipase